MSINLNRLSFNIITPKQTGGTPINVIKRESSSPKNALDVSIEVGVMDALVLTLDTSTKDAVVAVPLPSRTGVGDQHEDDGGKLSPSIRRDNSGMFNNIIKRIDTSQGTVYTVIKRESSSPKNALDVGLLTSVYDALDVGSSTSDWDSFVPSGPGFLIDPYGPLIGPTYMYVDTVGNTITNLKARGGI